MNVKPGSDAHMERLAIRGRRGFHVVRQCGIDRSDFDRFIIGNEGKPNT